MATATTTDEIDSSSNTTKQVMEGNSTVVVEVSTDDGNSTDTSNTTIEASIDDGNLTDTTTTVEEEASTDDGNLTDTTTVEEEEEDDPSEIDEMIQIIDHKTIGEDIKRATEGETINEEEEEEVTRKINEEDSSETTENAKVDE